MLPLLGPGLPASREELIVALNGGLERLLHLPASQTVVEAAGTRYPALDLLRIDVTGARWKETYRPVRPAGPAHHGVTTARLEVVGRQVRYQQATVAFALEAEEACFAFRSHAQAGSYLEPVTARQGRFWAQMSHADLESLLRSTLQAAAATHGLVLEKTDLTLACPDERSVVFQVCLTGSKRLGFFTVRAALRGRGRLVVDDRLQATLSGLACEGEGVVGQLLVKLLREHLQVWEGRSFPLTAFSLGALTLRDLKIGCQDGLHVEAFLGS